MRRNWYSLVSSWIFDVLILFLGGRHLLLHPVGPNESQPGWVTVVLLLAFSFYIRFWLWPLEDVDAKRAAAKKEAQQAKSSRKPPGA
jgi:hypothetical protein